MRKSLFLAMIAALAFVTTGCQNSKPSSVKGTWEYSFLISEPETVLTESDFIISSDATKDAPATVTYKKNGKVYLSAEVLVNYDPSEGKGSFASASGKRGAKGTFEAMDKDELSVNLYEVEEDGYSRALLVNALYVKK